MQQRQSATRSQPPNKGDQRGEGAGPSGPFSPVKAREPFRGSLINMLGLAAFDAVALYVMWGLVGNGKSIVAIVVLVVTVLVNLIFLTDRLYPIRWMTPGLLLLIL